ncbi:MAG: YndJ family transporter [Myxococcales bacterium]|nr:YndJ family transporter [Myxococcales bacterium]
MSETVADASRQTSETEEGASRPGRVDTPIRSLAWFALAGVPLSVATRWVPGAPQDTLNRAVIGAVLVVAPLGLAVAWATSPGGRGVASKLRGLLAWLVPLAGVGAVGSMIVPATSATAAVLVGPWVAATLLAVAERRLALGRAWREPEGLAALGAIVCAAVGAGWLAAARLGLAPFGVDPITHVLVVVHLHSATLAGPLFAAAALRRLASDGRPARPPVAWIATGGQLLGAVGVALGVLVSRPVQSVGTLVLTVGLALACVLVLRACRGAPWLPRLLLLVAVASAAVAMPLALAQAAGRPFGASLTLEWMLRIHGQANLHGFSACGLGGAYLLLRSPTRGD